MFTPQVTRQFASLSTETRKEQKHAPPHCLGSFLKQNNHPGFASKALTRTLFVNSFLASRMTGQLVGQSQQTNRTQKRSKIGSNETAVECLTCNHSDVGSTNGEIVMGVNGWPWPPVVGQGWPCPANSAMARHICRVRLALGEP